MVDFFLLLMISGAGDELQGIKRGIMEMADAIAINKADGDNKTKAQIACTQIKNALHLFPLPESAWSPPAVICSSLTGEGIPEIWGKIGEYIDFTKDNGYFDQKRMQQNKQIMLDTIDAHLHDLFYRHPEIRPMLQQAEMKIKSGQLTPYQAAGELTKHFLEVIKK
jgi:LAO/AO transport system kinase